MSPVNVRIANHLPMTTADGSFQASATRSATYSVTVVDSAAQVASALARELADRKAFLVTDETVLGLHARALAEALRCSGIETRLKAFPAGEGSKHLGTACQLLDWLADSDMRRRDVLVPVGGGVVCDTAGWTASVYMRGVSYVNVPTTLMAQVDAAIGGKVGVDHSRAKNLIGAFHQPQAVLTCLAYLDTLDAREMRNGLAEVVKKASIASPALFRYLERQWREVLGRDSAALRELVRTASSIKIRLIADDPYEKDLRRPLNFGHTVGHALETVTGYHMVAHGEAISVGMAVAVRIAAGRGILDEAVAARITGLLRRLGLPVAVNELATPVCTDSVVSALDKIRHIRDGSLRFVLPTDLGEVQICDDVTDDEVKAALRQRALAEVTR
jgi:3-dehydroquinate synthase